MLRLRSSVDARRAPQFAETLRDLEGVRRLVQQEDESAPRSVVFVADVEPHAADVVVDAIAEIGIPLDEYLLTRVEVVAQLRANSRPLARYLALMTVAAIIAALGVITSSSILIVGAMAASPDLLPICATCVGLVGGRRGLAIRSFLTLNLGLALVVVSAAILSVSLDVAGVLPDGFDVSQRSLHTLAQVDYTSVLIALAAGVAAMLSFETRASTAVGVAISVTTMPASAYLGVAIGVGDPGDGLPALIVLAVNVALLIVSGSATLLVQRWIASRSSAGGSTPVTAVAPGPDSSGRAHGAGSGRRSS